MSRKSETLTVADRLPGPIALKKERIKAENDSDVGSDFCNDSIFDDSSDQEGTKQSAPPQPPPSLLERQKEFRLITARHCLQLYKDRKKIPNLVHTRTSTVLPSELLKFPTAYNSPLASQNNVSFAFSSGKSLDAEVSNSRLFTLPIRTKYLTRMFGFHFKSLNAPTILRGHEKLEKLKALCKKNIPKKFLAKYKKKQLKKEEKARKKLEKKEKQRKAVIQDLVTNIIPNLDYDGVIKVLNFTKPLKRL